MNNILEIIFWSLSLFFTIFFAGMEIAFTTSDKLRYALDKKNKNIVDFIINIFYSHSRKFLFTLTTGNIFALVVFVYYSISLSTGFIETHITSSQFLILLIQLAIIAIIILITSELLPRIVFKNNANLWVKILAIPSFFFYVLFFPITKFLSAIGSNLLRLFGVKFNPAEEKVLGRVELDSYVKQGVVEMPDDGAVESDVQIFKNALDFSSIRLKDCMIPSADIVALSDDVSIEEVKDTFIQTGFSKILIYKDDIDDIIGYIHMWEMFSNPTDWTKGIASISFYPESMLAKTLMSELLQQHKSIAVVVDEYGGTSGIITIEDLVEEIFGDIEDEYDVNTNIAKKLNDNEYIISGRLEIDQLNEMFDLGLPSNDDYTTLAGYILNHTQRFPKIYETVEIDNYTFKILKVTSRKIEIVKLISNP